MNNADFKKLLRRRSKELRIKQTAAEQLLWQQLRAHRFSGLKFKRQYLILPFIVDFYCHELNLIVEVDGDIHDLEEIKEKDIRREAFLKSKGYRIIRFTNERVFSDMNYVLEEIGKLKG